jgi:hypothetical protein
MGAISILWAALRSPSRRLAPPPRRHRPAGRPHRRGHQRPRRPRRRAGGRLCVWPVSLPPAPPAGARAPVLPALPRGGGGGRPGGGEGGGGGGGCASCWCTGASRTCAAARRGAFARATQSLSHLTASEQSSTRAAAPCASTCPHARLATQYLPNNPLPPNPFHQVVLYAFYKNVTYVSCFIYFAFYSGAPEGGARAGPAAGIGRRCVELCRVHWPRHARAGLRAAASAAAPGAAKALPPSPIP